VGATDQDSALANKHANQNQSNFSARKRGALMEYVVRYVTVLQCERERETNLHAVACHRAHRTSDLREDDYGGQPEER
jgi:hypothetical protein